ncbi:MAG: hypothetical protein ACT4QG_21330 [Sporichthyaceae bacterium]
MALRKPAAAGRAGVNKRHRGETSDAMRVLGQTAAVAGISGALLLSLKAMVLIAPAVLPNGSGLDALGRPAPNVASVDDLAAPVAIGRVVEDAFGAPAAPATPRVSGVSENNGASVGRGNSNGSSRPSNNNGSNGSNGSSGSNGGTKAPAVKETGAVGGVVGTLGGLLDGVAPGTGKTLADTTAPVTGTVDNLTKSLGLDKTLGDVTGSLGLTEKKSTPASSSTDEGLGGVVGGLTGTLGLGGNSASNPGLVDGLGKTLGLGGLGL